MDASRPTPHPIKAVLASRRLSNRWLAGTTGLSEKYLSAVINGDRSPGGRCRRSCAAALRVPETELWDFDRLGINPVTGERASGGNKATAGIVAGMPGAIPTGVAAVETLARLRALCKSGRARELRLELDIELVELARAIEVEPNVLWKWETGTTRPKGEPALRYAAALDSLAALTVAEDVPA